MIDLRSDTITKPTKEMLEFMMSAEVGDDVFEDDPTVNRLQKIFAELFDMEAAIFCPSGTMTNQIAVNVQTNPGDEIICDRLSHVYNHEGGGIARNSGVSTRLIIGDRGRFNAKDVEENINPDDPHYPATSLVCIENTCNKGGGSVWDYNEIIKIAATCENNNLKLHLDGARLFNALNVTDQAPSDYGYICNSISICLSKGLGAPVGSLLLGKKEFIQKAQRVRKVFGGGMRQVGYLAAAGIYALENNIDRITIDHNNARILESILKKLSYIKEIFPVETNIVLFELIPNVKTSEFLDHLEKNKILAIELSSHTIRLVTHLGISENDIDKVYTALRSFRN